MKYIHLIVQDIFILIHMKNYKNKVINKNNSLKSFKGTVLFTTHDHEFAQTVANRVVELTPKGIIDRHMRFDEYMQDSKIKILREKMYA